MNNLEIKKIIGDLEVMALATEPGVVITKEMSVSCSATLLKAICVLKKYVYGDMPKASS